MYGYLQKRVEVLLSRIGREVVIYDRSVGSKDGFNNPSDSYSDSGNTTQCVRTYPNRNTEVSTTAGDLHRDNPVFVFPNDDAPGPEARIEYPEDAETVTNASETTKYEMQAPTFYDSHVEMFGEVVVND